MGLEIGDYYSLPNTRGWHGERAAGVEVVVIDEFAYDCCGDEMDSKIGDDCLLPKSQRMAWGESNSMGRDRV